jgi:hypothetical protein
VRFTRAAILDVCQVTEATCLSPIGAGAGASAKPLAGLSGSKAMTRSLKLRSTRSTIVTLWLNGFMTKVMGLIIPSSRTRSNAGDGLHVSIAAIRVGLNLSGYTNPGIQTVATIRIAGLLGDYWLRPRCCGGLR